jgi:hypothetical protein
VPHVKAPALPGRGFFISIPYVALALSKLNIRPTKRLLPKKLGHEKAPGLKNWGLS